MRSKEEVRLVQRLAARGLNNCEIARATGIPRGTIRDWLAGRTPRNARNRRQGCPYCGHDPHDPAELPREDYSYLLGLYLGDGSIATHHRAVHRLRIVLDMRYPKIIGECVRTMKAVMPANRVNVQTYVGGGKAVEVGSYFKSWPCLFPQHGPGAKHERKIKLVDWQQDIVDEHPAKLVRGLIHSDGCRVMNKSMGRVYVRYFFDNVSEDIRQIFCSACDQLGIEWRHPKERTISIARRESIALLDTFVGPKT